MLDLLPPRWIRGDMFAMREFFAGSLMGGFLTLKIDCRIRHFHGYCDRFDRSSPDRSSVAIIERESRPVKVTSREERIEHIWNSAHNDYRGYAGERWPEFERRKCTGGTVRSYRFASGIIRSEPGGVMLGSCGCGSARETEGLCCEMARAPGRIPAAFKRVESTDRDQGEGERPWDLPPGVL
jgi:hypothetical protein